MCVGVVRGGGGGNVCVCGGGGAGVAVLCGVLCLDLGLFVGCALRIVYGPLRKIFCALEILQLLL